MMNPPVNPNSNRIINGKISFIIKGSSWTFPLAITGIKKKNPNLMTIR